MPGEQSTAPRVIYLQTEGGEGEPLDPAIDEVTWCQDMINDDDVAYILCSEFNDVSVKLEAMNHTAELQASIIVELKEKCERTEAELAEVSGEMVRRTARAVSIGGELQKSYELNAALKKENEQLKNPSRRLGFGQT